MAFFKQLRLLLKHKILLRRRQPTTLFLELFWPAIVFLAILIVRWQFPATFRQTCYYNAKALPSAGIVNLMQSYVCNVDNTCLNASQYQEVPNYPNASIHDIVDQLMPLLTNKNVTNVINDLPKGIRLIASIIDTLSITPVQNLLEDGFPLRNALRPAGWTKVEHELNRLESTVVPFSDFDLVAKTDSIESHNNNNNHSTLSSYEMLVNSSLNLIQLGMQSDSSGFRSIRSFRDVICDHTQLEKFLIVPQRHYVRLLSRRLCLLERKDLYHLFDLVQENIDFGRILEKLSTILKSVGLVDHQQNVDNIIAMISTIERANIFRSVSALRNTSWMYDMPNLFNVLRSGDIDVGTLLKIVDDIEPILYDDEDDDEDNNGDENEQIDSSMEDPINPLDDQRQQQQLDFIMQFYNADDSTLKNVANWPFESDDNSTMLINDDEDDLELPNLSDTTLDLDVSESKSSNVASSTTSRRANSNIQNESLSRKFLPKLLANMDRLIDNVEAFTQTPQWDSLLSTFEGLQMLLEISDDDGADSATILSAKNKLSSMKIEKIVLTLPKKFQTFSNFLNSLIPEKFQPLIYPLFNLLHRASDSTLQHLGGAFSRALAEDKIYYFDKFAQLLIYSIHNGTFPRKCIDIQQAMCDLEQFKNVFVYNVDEDTGESSILYDEDPGTLQGIQELGCLFLGQNYWQENEEESTPILAKLYYTLSTLNETNLLSSLTTSSNLSSPLSSSTNSSSNTSSTSSDDAFWTNFTSRMLEVYLLATKSVPANTWNTIWNELRSVWKSNDTPDRIIYLSRIIQLSADCFIPNGIVQSTIWRAIYRKKAIAHELFNVVLNEINTSAESETLKVSQIAMGSPTLEQFFQNNLKIFPTLIDAMAETFFFHLPQFVDKLFQSSSYMITGWPCNRHSLADMFTFKSDANLSLIRSIEEFICTQTQMRMGDRFRIVDELTDPSNNESRIAPLIRAMQSKSLNLTEIHQNLPPLDWVEAATSVSLIKESVEKIISMDNSLVWFPDVPQLDNSIRSAIDRSHQAYRRFSTQGTVGMIAYIGDIVTPFIDRYLILNETFSTSCDMGLAGLLMAPVYHDKEWRCLFISLKYASYSINHLFELINEVLANLLSGHHSCTLSENGNTNSSNVNRLISLSENMPEVVEILLNELLVGNRNRISHTGSIRDLLCGSNQNLDIFGRRGVLYNEIRQNICNLTNDLVTCTHLTMPEQWQQAFEHLNDTWYIQSPDNLSSKASFADAYRNIYQFFTLFGQFSPSTVNHLIETFRSTDGQQYVANILKRMNRFDHLRGKRFVYIMQTMSDELFTLLFGNRLPQNQRLTEERRDLLMALIYAFNELPARLRQRYKLGGIYVKIPPMAINPDVDDDDMLLHADLLDSLLDWIDAHLLVASETFLQTITLDMQRLLKLFQNRYDMVTVWRSFCRSPLSQYVVVDNQISVGAHKAKDEICQLDFNAVFDQWYRSSQSLLSNHTDRELIDLFLFKAGSFLDIVLKDSTYKRDLLKSDDWFPILSKLKRLVLGSETTDSSNGWLIDSMSQFLHVLYPKPTLELIHRGMKRFECGLDTITPNGLNWELVPNIYRNKTQVLSLFSSINSAFTLGTIGLNTFLVQVKFYKYLQMITKYGGRGFCYLKSEQDFEDIFAVSNAIGHSTDDAIMVLRNLQSLLCNSNHDLMFQLNPVSQCFRMKISSSQPNSIGSDLQALQNKFVNTFSKVHNEVEADDQETSLIPPILDLDQWNRFFQWWSKEVTPYPNSGRTLLSMRMFQLVDVLADNHVIWKAFYRLTFIVSEMFAYSLRALQLSEAMYPMKPNLQISTDNIPLKMIKHSVDSSTNRKGMSSLLTSTVSNLIFPEVNHFITFATFRQLRWIKHISHFFAKHPNILHDELCPTLNSIHNQKMSNSSASSPITVDDDFNDLLLLLCHNHPSDWIYTLTFKSNLFNVKTSPRPKLISHRRIRERIGKLTQVLARMLDYNSEKNNNQKLDQVVRFIKLKQLESIENVAGTATLLTDAIMLSQKNGKSTNYVKSSFRELINTGWRSVPALLDAVDQYICNYKRSDNGSSANDDDGLPPFLYRPKAPDMKIVMCEMPQWDFDRAYSYLSKHLDLRHMLQMFVAASGTGSNGTTTARCVTPLRFISRWVDMSQDIFEQLSTSSFWSELKSCRRRHLLTILAASKSSSNNFLFKHSLRYVRFMNGLFSTVDKFSHDSNGLSWDNIRELWRTFSYFVLNQVPAYVPITDIVRHDVNLPEFLNATLDRVSTLSRSRAKQAIRLLTDSALDINLISWHNFSNIALKEMICRQQENSQVSARQTLSKQYLPLILANSAQRRNVSLDTSQLNLYETLCQSGSLIQIIDSLMSVIDQKSIYSKLSDLQRNELAKSEWIANVFMPEMSQLSTEMISSGTLLELGDKISLLQNAAKTESSSQKGINHLLISFVSLTRAKNFNTLYDTIKRTIDKLMPRFSEGPIIDTLSRILEGLRSLKDLSNSDLFQIKYQISDLLVNVENVKIFLEMNLGLDRSAVNQIANATIDLSEFLEMSASTTFDSSAFCNQSLLFENLKLQLPTPAPMELPVQADMVTNALCTLTVTEDFKFNNQILNQLVIRKLTNNIVSLIMNGLLKKAAIQSNEIGKALNAVRASSKSMPYVKRFIRELSQSIEGIHQDQLMEENSLPLSTINGIRNISLNYTSNLVGKIMCGRSFPALNREMKLLKVKVQQPVFNQAELNSFSSEFCRNGYREIMQMQGGAVIWNFIKPILLGKVLYTPKAPVIDSIMANMNSTLRFMPRIVEMFHAWSQTLSSLETFYNQSDVNNRMSHVKHLIESVFINGEADGLFDDVDTFNMIERMTRSGNALAILKLIGQVAQCASFDRFVGVDSELELEEISRNLTKSHEFIAGIVFVGTSKQYANIRTIPKNIEYKIRIDIDFVPSTKSLKARIWEPGPRDNYVNDMGYLHGFVQIQEMIDRSIIAYLTNRTNLLIDPKVHVQQQPYLCYDIDKFGNYIRSLAPLITTMAWIFLIAYLIREHVLERELHLEEVMRVMGLKSGVAWLSWFLIGITVMAFATLCGITLLYIGQLIPASDPILLFLFFMVFNISLLMFCYMMSSFFKTATIAALSGIVAYLASFLPFMVAITLENEMNLSHKVITCFSMSTSFCFGMMYMTRFEVQGVGMQWNNLWHSPMQGDPMNVGTAMIMMTIDSIIYFLIGWYISHVNPPGNNARRYPWFFFLSPLYWKYDFTRSFGFGEEDFRPIDDRESVFSSNYGTNNKLDHSKTLSISNDEDNISMVMENDTTFNIIDPEEIKSINGRDFLSDDMLMTDGLGTLKTISGTLRKTIQQNCTLTRKASNESSSSSSTISQSILGMELRGLYVIYNERSNRSKHIAVSNLNLTLKEGQITTILGRNGAGKTTTINVLTGQLPPTSGTVTIYGHRIPEDFGQARRLLGYCPQYNTLFNNLTVREHLMFFAELKGLLQDETVITKDVEEILQNMGLWSMQHQLAKHLSGGLKRRLCVALAFVGGSKLIILDEPTASVDPVARRNIWDLIVQQKRFRTVLLTTHHMDEAEILSDEVAVIHRGKLLCSGSPLLLKSKYGCGYQLTVSRQAISSNEENVSMDITDQQRHDTITDEEEFAVNSMETTAEMYQNDIERLMAFIKCLIPNASFIEDNNGEVILSLPQYDDHGVPHDYATFFRCFEANIRTLGFGSYGVTSTTLEEVFLTLCNLEESNMPVDEAKLAVARRMSYSNGKVASLVKCGKLSKFQPTSDSDKIVHQQSKPSLEVELETGFRLKSRQLYALLSKRFLHMIRDWKLLFCTLFLPCLFIAFAMAMTLIKPSFAPDPSLPLLPQIYGQNTVSFLWNPQSHHQRSSINTKTTKELRLIEQQLISSNHSEIDCLQPRQKWKSSKCPILFGSKMQSNLPPHLLTFKGKAWDRNTRRSCKCYECSIDIASMAYLIPSPDETAYGYIYNLSRGVDINNFLLRTQPEFMDRRWGGWSFHQIMNNKKNIQQNLSNMRGKKNSSLMAVNDQNLQMRSIVKVWFDNNGFHSIPSYLSAINNALLRANLKEAGVANYSNYHITTYSHPLHVRSSQIGDQSVMQQAGDAGIAIIILVGFIFIPTSFVFYIVRERLFEEKHLQRTFGVGPCLYWISALLWDVTVLIVAIILASAIIAFFRLPIYMSRLNLPAVLCLLFFFGWAMINLVYLAEKLFTEPSIAFMVLYCVALFVGIHTMVMRLMIDVFKLVDITPTLYQLFEKVAVIFPPYLLLIGIVDVHRNQLFADIFSLFDQDVYVNPFHMELIGKHYAVFVVEGCILFIINLCLECGLIAKVKSLFLSRSRSQLVGLNHSREVTMAEDNDVAEERRRVNLTFGVQEPESSGSSSVSQSSTAGYSDSSSNNGSIKTSSSTKSDILRVFGVTKVFESIFGFRRAVSNVTFSVPRGECFGLLGVNGAGKTTLFRILTGQVEATMGEATFNGKSIRDALANGCVKQSIGYCPQADALDDFLTPIEHLRIYANLRGISAPMITHIVMESIAKFQLQTHSNMPVRALSRGNRRKLCLAIAMIGNPQLILLDEPTSGLDPQSRRYICQNIQDAIRDQRSILLTSHSMEECDILCSRLAIMVNGRFKCIGSPQYLKHKFGTGYIITLRLSEVKANFKEAIEFIKENFTQSILRAHHHTMLEFNLPTNDLPLSNIFQVLQRAQSILSLQDYSVSQTTLDQVFVSFASQQVNDGETYEMEMMKSVKNKDNNNGTIIGDKVAKPSNQNLSSTISANIHGTKDSLKRHASMLMSLCHSGSKKSKFVVKKSDKNHSLKSNYNSSKGLDMNLSSNIIHQSYHHQSIYPYSHKHLKRVNSHVSSNVPFNDRSKYWPKTTTMPNNNSTNNKNRSNHYKTLQQQSAIHKQIQPQQQQSVIHVHRYHRGNPNMNKVGKAKRSLAINQNLLPRGVRIPIGNTFHPQQFAPDSYQNQKTCQLSRRSSIYSSSINNLYSFRKQPNLEPSLANANTNNIPKQSPIAKSTSPPTPLDFGNSYSHQQRTYHQHHQHQYQHQHHQHQQPKPGGFINQTLTRK